MELSSSDRTLTSNFIVRDSMEYEWSRDIESYYVRDIIQLNSLVLIYVLISTASGKLHNTNLNKSSETTQDKKREIKDIYT
jgi:hypothetical protein